MARKRKTRILLVEDDFYILDIYQTKLTQEGFKVLIAEDGEEAVKTVKKELKLAEVIDLILLDISMPHMNGLECIKSLKAVKGAENIPFIVLTNLVKQSLLDEFFALGAIDYLVKADYTPRQIVAKVNAHLEKLQKSSAK